MKEIVRICIKYSLISLPIGIIASILAANESHIWLTLVVAIIGLAIFYFFLNDMGKLISVEDIRKLYVVAIRLFIAELIVFSVLLILLSGTPIVNWLNAAGFNVIFLTLSIMLLIIAKQVRKSHELPGCLLYMVTVLLIVMIIVGNLLFVSGFN